MKKQEIISALLDRENTLSIKRIQHNITPGSMGNPQITVGTLPFYKWDKPEDQKITYVITYGRYLNCEMLVYKKLRAGLNCFETKDRKEAEIYISNIIDKAIQTV